ncbi:GNAT family N-acetyltransferase [Phormidium sp. CLA17]|uniref:GNAT family N-acetyltransferase n=1 Tax=Leptolyngbya sp. Cla-17 TaxID=2803751 RepID=UPI0014915702|nr:GNAT family N-acetyltransferase [Leptolyngbya sp. Cla-17]MBM0742916.1 GNAT family N-acetyltransferase [Leptolyngbya sp. Cla-17]
MPIHFETDRLLIRDWLPEDDAEQAFEIYGDPIVMQFIGSGKIEESVETQRLLLQRIVSRYAEVNNGTGAWAIAEKSSGQIVGTVILKQLPDGEGQLTQDYEIGWNLRQASWGKGYATEAAQTAIAYGFQNLNLAVIYAVTNPANHASIRVTQRLGMIPLGKTQKYYGVETELFKLENPSKDKTHS